MVPAGGAVSGIMDIDEENDMADFNDGIIAEFRANGGRLGGPFEGAPMVLVHPPGPHRAAERVTPR